MALTYLIATTESCFDSLDSLTHEKFNVINSNEINTECHDSNEDEDDPDFSADYTTPNRIDLIAGTLRAAMDQVNPMKGSNKKSALVRNPVGVAGVIRSLIKATKAINRDLSPDDDIDLDVAIGHLEFLDALFASGFVFKEKNVESTNLIFEKIISIVAEAGDVLCVEHIKEKMGGDVEQNSLH